MPSLNTLVSADGEILPAPDSANRWIRLLGYQITSQGDPGRVTLNSGSTVVAGVSSFSSSGGGAMAPPVGIGGEPYADIAKQTALTVTVENSAVDVDVTIQYAIMGR